MIANAQSHLMIIYNLLYMIISVDLKPFKTTTLVHIDNIKKQSINKNNLDLIFYSKQ